MGMSLWSGHRWPARVFLRTIAPPQGPRIISTWWRSYSGRGEPWRPAAPCSRSGTSGGAQGAAKRPRAGELRKQTHGSRWCFTKGDLEFPLLDRVEHSAFLATALEHHLRRNDLYRESQWCAARPAPTAGCPRLYAPGRYPRGLETRPAGPVAAPAARHRGSPARPPDRAAFSHGSH